MAEMVGSAVVQEAVSGAVSLVFSDHEGKPSKRHTMERLEMAHIGLEFALERSSKLPITEVALLRQRWQIKRFYEECGEVLDKHKVRVLEDEEGVTNSSFPKRIIHTVKSSVSNYFFSSDKDELSLSQVRRFERYGDEADRFVRRVESGCSLLAHYMFFNPLITQLLQGKDLWYEMVQGSQIRRLRIYPLRSQEHGILATLRFDSYDRKIQTKCFISNFWLRLSESTDIIGIATKCLQSLGPQFKSLVQVAAGEFSELPTENFFSCSPNSVFSCSPNSLVLEDLVTTFRPDPLCCMANGHMPCANNVIPSKLSYRFPEQVMFMHFRCSISAFEYNMQNSADEAERNVVNDWPVLIVSASSFPHSVNKSGKMYVSKIIGEQVEHISGTSLQQTDEMFLTDAVNCFIRQPELTSYQMIWNSLHGDVCFTVKKPKEKVRPKPRAGPTTRRAAKRRR